MKKILIGLLTVSFVGSALATENVYGKVMSIQSVGSTSGYTDYSIIVIEKKDGTSKFLNVRGSATATVLVAVQIIEKEVCISGGKSWKDHYVVELK